MATAEVIDFEALLKPLTEDNPAGEDVREGASSKAYYAVKDARTAARSKERSVVTEEEGEVPDTRSEWRPVLEQAQALLTETGKDLEVTAWMIEALTRLHGFAGLRDGFRLARELVPLCWDHWLPEPDEDGIEERVAPLAGLNGVDADGTLIVPIRNVPITEGTSVGPLACWQYQQAVALQQMTDVEARQKRIDAGGVTLEQLAQAGVETSREFFETTLDDLGQCREEFATLCELLDERCGEHAPPSSNIRNALESCVEALRYAGKEILVPEADEEEGAAGTEAGSGASAASGTYPRSREQAFKTLLELSDFFRRNEPHSPISYALEQVVRWGRMSLPDLLQELIAEESARDNLFRLAGIKKPEEPQ